MPVPAKTLLRVLEVLAWAAFFAFAIIFLSLRYWVLPRVEHYREDLVSVISSSVGLPVKIGAIGTDWQGLRPKISISDVRIYDRDGREALALPAVENVLSWRSLLVFDLRLHSFVIDGLKLSVRRDAQGAIYVAGIRLTSDQQKGDGRLGDWILSQNQIVMRDAEVEWIDESRKAPPLRLTALNFRLQNDGDAHSVGISARPPKELGPGVEIRGQLKGRSVAVPETWSGRVFAEFGYTDIAGWRRWVDYPIDVRRGEGALRVWASFDAGKFKQATADVALANVSARLGKDLPVLEMSQVSGRVYGSETDNGYDFGARNLALTSPGTPAMNSTSFHASWQPANGALAQRGNVTANLVELGPLAHVAEFLPFPADLRKLLAELAPQGNLLDAKFEWTGTLPDQATYVARTRFAGLTMKPWRSIPGFVNLSGSLEANERKGSVTLASRKGEIDLPRVFPESHIKLDALSGDVGWERGAPDGGVAVKLANIGFANEDIAGTAYGSYLWTGEGPGVVDLTAQLSRAQGKATAKYLPLSTIMGARTREWVASAVQGGLASEARLRLRGDLRDFPFADPAKGVFEVTANVSGAILDYAEGWPRLEQIEGRLSFERDKIEVHGRTGSILGAKIGNVRVTLPSLVAEETHLLVEGHAEGPTQEFLDYIRESPVRRMVSGLTDGMSASGRGRLRLRLDLPLADLSRTKVTGEYQMQGNNVTVDQRLPPIEKASGSVRFTESGLSLQDMRGQLFGDQVRIGGGTKAGAGVAVTAEGRATIEGLRAVFDHPWRRRLSGSTRYIATVTTSEGRPHINFETQLEGIASALPPPLAKNAADALPLRVEVLPGEGRDRISVQLGRIVAAEFLRAGQGGAMQVQRSLITLNPVAGEPMRVPERRGVTVRGALPVLDLERWLPLLNEGGGDGEGASFDLRVGVLDAMGKRMRNVAMQGVTEPGGWSANMSTAEFAGDLVYRTEGSGRLAARFTRFTLPEESPNAKPAETAKDLPAVDIVADNFTHRGRRLGRVEVQARHEGRDWRIDKLAVTNADAALSGSGLWKQGDASRTTLNFKLDVVDVGKFLERMGYGEHLKGGRGVLEGGLNWGGDPVSMDYATLNGALNMKVEDGQFLEIEPGVGKLVSLMSLQMLPRRLTLDFRDVFSKGFQFDRITSALNIERGAMNVKDLHMNGPAADVYMQGQVDLSLETQNLNVKVIPQLGDTASTVVGLVNPFAGVATLIAGRLMKNPLGKLFAFDYRVSGTWSDPKVEKVVPKPVAPDPNSILNR